MKKNKMMRLASFLLVAVLITTSAISGTYAKYVTTSNGNDSARVAKWGVELQVFGNLFGDTYKNSIVAEDDTTAAVQSLNKSDDVVAPGTENNEGFTFSLKGRPEVDGIISSTLTVQNVFLAEGTYGVMIPVDDNTITLAVKDEMEGLDDATNDAGETVVTDEKDAVLYKQDGGKFVAVKLADIDEEAEAKAEYFTLEDVVTTSDYYPVVYALAGGTTYSAGGVGSDSLDAIAKLIAHQLCESTTSADGTTTSYDYTVSDDPVTSAVTYNMDRTFQSNDDLADAASVNLDDQRLTWKWDFGSETVSNVRNTDKADTILGHLAAQKDGDIEGVVVMKSGSDYVVPTEYKNYCVDTQFDLAIVVEQTN